MTTTHTPGPWDVQGNGDTFSIVSRTTDDVIAEVIYVPEEGLEPLESSDGRNARLIAAAPDLLALVHEIAVQDPITGLPPQLDNLVNYWIAQAKAIDAKARGET